MELDIKNNLLLAYKKAKGKNQVLLDADERN